MKCNKCNKTFPNYIQYCSECGDLLVDEDEKETYEISEEEENTGYEELTKQTNQKPYKSAKNKISKEEEDFFDSEDIEIKDTPLGGKKELNDDDSLFIAHSLNANNKGASSKRKEFVPVSDSKFFKTPKSSDNERRYVSSSEKKHTVKINSTSQSIRKKQDINFAKEKEEQEEREFVHNIVKNSDEKKKQKSVKSSKNDDASEEKAMATIKSLSKTKAKNHLSNMDNDLLNDNDENDITEMPLIMKIIMGLFGIILITGLLGFGIYYLVLNFKHQNHTGNSSYKAKDVKYNCVLNTKYNKIDTIIYADIVNIKANNQIRVYYKIVMKDQISINDAKYRNIIDSLNLSKYVIMYNGSEYSDNLKLSYTEYGHDTQIMRNDNVIEITSFNFESYKDSSANGLIEDYHKELMDEGYKCK